MFEILEKILLFVPSQVNLKQLGIIVAEVEMSGGHKAEIIEGIIARADVIFPDPVIRPIALRLVNALNDFHLHTPPKN